MTQFLLLLTLFCSFFCEAHALDQIQIGHRSNAAILTLEGGASSVSEDLYTIIDEDDGKDVRVWPVGDPIPLPGKPLDRLYKVELRIEPKVSSFQIDSDQGRTSITLRGDIARELYHDLREAGIDEQHSELSPREMLISQGGFSCSRNPRHAHYKCKFDLAPSAAAHFKG